MEVAHHTPTIPASESSDSGRSQTSRTAAQTTSPDADTDSLSATESQPEEQSHLGFRRSDQLFVGLLVAVALILMTAHWVRLSRWGRLPVEIERLSTRVSEYEYELDINAATWVEWAQLEGIGETLAQRIVADRESNGPFSGIDDLQRVKGIGPKTIERLRPQLTSRIAHDSEPSSSPRSVTGGSPPHQTP